MDSLWEENRDENMGVILEFSFPIFFSFQVCYCSDYLYLNYTRNIRNCPKVIVKRCSPNCFRRVEIGDETSAKEGGIEVPQLC